MQRGVRYIDGREFLLAGRADDKERAQSQAQSMRDWWTFVRIVKVREFDYMIYVHGAK